jgi:carboxyl-terminal processing protease
MTAPLRLLLAVAIVAASAVGGAAYAERVAAQEPAVVSDRPVATMDFSQLIGTSDPDRRLIETAYEQLIHSYYEPVNPQLILDGESKALNAYIRAKAKPAVAVSDAKADGLAAHDLPAIEQTVAMAEQRNPALNKTQLTNVAVAGMLAGLGDPYTTYLSADAIRALQEELKGGNFGGIGVYIGKDPRTGAVVVDPIEGNPAIKAGVRTADAIIAVNDQPTAGKPLDEVEQMIRGPRGTVVALRVKHLEPCPNNASDCKPIYSSAVATINVTRDVVHVPSVLAKMEDGFSYVRLSDFGSTSADEIRAAFLDAKAKGAKGYILDLRNNGGGLLDAAVDVSSLFIPQGTIVSTIDRAGDKDVRSAEGDAIGAQPLVVLVNKYTASSSEITAGALQDYGAATLIGTKTFGKGVVQSLYMITNPDRGALKITTARYVTPKGRDIQHKGIVPDIVIDQRVDAPIIDTPADKQLAAAKALLKKDQQ